MLEHDVEFEGPDSPPTAQASQDAEGLGPDDREERDGPDWDDDEDDDYDDDPDWDDDEDDDWDDDPDWDDDDAYDDDDWDEDDDEDEWERRRARANVRAWRRVAELEGYTEEA
jgi:hypothetical protein